MRVLWFTNSPCNYKAAGGYNGGGWMTALQDEIVSLEEPNVELGISFVMNDQPWKIVQESVTYYPVPVAVKSKKDKILDIIYPNDVHRDEVLWGHYIDRFKKVIDDFKPDIIEIFGSELYMGLASFATDIPCVLHIQGLLSSYIHVFLPLGVSRSNYILKDGYLRSLGNWQFLNYWKRSVYREKSILKHVKHFIGRTNWDRDTSNILNPFAKYHYGGEILRRTFYSLKERSIPKKMTLVSTISQPPYKGFDIVLRIANILKNELSFDFIWKVYGDVESQIAEKVVGVDCENVNVILCGVASAEELKDALLSSTAYVHPSYIENSPNSVCEAQLLGIPIVATNVGGTSSLIEDGVTGYMFPPTDPYIAVSKILELYKDTNLNTMIGEAAQKVALVRHDKKKIINQLIETYKRIIADDRKDN